MKTTLIFVAIISLMACQKDASTEVKPSVKTSKKVLSRGTGDFQLYSFSLSTQNTKKGQQQITLNWTAAGESNIYYYGVETFRKWPFGGNFWMEEVRVPSSRNDAITDKTCSY